MGMDLMETICALARENGATAYAADIGDMEAELRHGYPYAVLFLRPLPVDFLRAVAEGKDVLHEGDAYDEAEHTAEHLADLAEEIFVNAGYHAESHAQGSLEKRGEFDWNTRCALLPHKAVALRTGIGWIGKSNLLVTRLHGSGQCLGVVLTDAPLPVEPVERMPSLCGSCTICHDICPVNALSGKSWAPGMDRDELLDITACKTCLKCMAMCPWTKAR